MNPEVVGYATCVANNIENSMNNALFELREQNTK
jgi:hypothetical protein